MILVESLIESYPSMATFTADIVVLTFTHLTTYRILYRHLCQRRAKQLSNPAVPLGVSATYVNDIFVLFVRQNYGMDIEKGLQSFKYKAGGGNNGGGGKKCTKVPAVIDAKILFMIKKIYSEKLVKK